MFIKQEEEEFKKKEADEKERMENEKVESEQLKLKEATEKEKMDLIRQQERDLLDTRSQPIRQYLMDNVVPNLTEGLIEICKSLPADPVDYLADYLLKKADELDEIRQKENENALISVDSP